MIYNPHDFAIDPRIPMMTRIIGLTVDLGNSSVLTDRDKNLFYKVDAEDAHGGEMSIFYCSIYDILSYDLKLTLWLRS